MSRSQPLILGIESSCDETAAAVVRGRYAVLSNVIATQHDLHERYAGVVPEIASRAHLERITPVVTEAVREAGVSFEDLDAIAVGNRPGLIGSLLVGVSAAKALAWGLGRPLIGVDHVHAHLVAGLLGTASSLAVSDRGTSFGGGLTGTASSLAVSDRGTSFRGRGSPLTANEDAVPSSPAIGLVVSGGHTNLYALANLGEIELLGRTIDDAVGEAYDKCATILGLDYPGGPAVDALAKSGDDRAHDFPVAALSRDRLDFSFSGLKTAVLYTVRGQPQGRGAKARFERDADALSDTEKADIAASFQRAAVTAVIRKLRRALDRNPGPRTLLVGGGVSANSRLRAELTALAAERRLDLRLPPLDLCVDNAAMIAAMAMIDFERGAFSPLTLSASARSAVPAHA